MSNIVYGQPIKPESQPMTPGMLTKVLKAIPDVTNTTNTLQPYGLSPMTGRPMVGKNVGTVMGFEGGTGISVTNATEKYGKKGTLLRRALRIDKRPWPTGQTDIRLRITVTFGHTIGFSGESAEPAVYIRNWNRNQPFQERFSSNVAGTNPDMLFYGYGAGSGSLRITLEPRGVGPGQPLVWEDENPMSETFTRCVWDEPDYSQGVTYMAMLGPPYFRMFMLPNIHWNTHHLSFSDGMLAVYYGPGQPLGVIQGVAATIECVGWDTGWHDLEGWHADTTLDPYQIPKPNTYEYPNYPISDPFNPTGPGVG